MSIEKSVHLVLSTMPFRETSVIATLLSRRFGRVSGIAKGVRRKPASPLILERGQLVEIVLYVRPHRDLHTIGAVSVINYFPSIRSDLGLLALRDACFELMLNSATASENHGEMFDFAAAFMSRLEALRPSPPPFHELWSFYHGWAGLSGVMLNVRECIRCRHPRVAAEGGLLAAERGGLVCSSCAGGRFADSPLFLPGTVAAFLLGRSSPPPLPAEEQTRVSRLLADWCRYHLDIRNELRSLSFLEGVVAQPTGR